MDLLGVEFSGSYTNNDYIKTGLTFTYAWGNLINRDKTTEPVDRIPPANGIFYVDYTPTNKLSIRPQARYAFSHRRISPSEIDDNRISQNGTDGFVNLQLLVNFYPDEHFKIKLIADNLIDEAYREHSSSLDGMGRNLTISMTYLF
jgi:outer membrane receptor protein involved in Fe transport